MPQQNTAISFDELYYLRASNRRKIQIRKLLILSAILLVVYWAAVGTDTSLQRFIDGLGFAYDFLGRALPPSFEYAQTISEMPRQPFMTNRTDWQISGFPTMFLEAKKANGKARIIPNVVPRRAIAIVSSSLNPILWAYSKFGGSALPRKS